MENKIDLNVPQFHKITRSFSRTIQVNQYEPCQVFSSHNEEIPIEEATPEKIKEISQHLYDLSVKDVRDGIKQYLEDVGKMKKDG